MVSRKVWVALLVGAILALFHLIVLGGRGHALLLVVALAILVWLAAVSLRPRRRGQSSGGEGTWPELLLLAWFLVGLVAFHAVFLRAASDGRGYFLQVRSLVLENDLDIGDEIQVFGAPDIALQHPSGSALLWAPMFTAAHVYQTALVALGSDLRVDGYSNPYQRAVGLATFLYGCLALWLIFRLIGRWYPPGIALAAVVALSAATPVAWYLIVEATMSHGVSMFAVTLFLYVWIEARDRESATRWAVLGLLAGLMTLVRFQNLALAIVLAPEGLGLLAGALRDRARLGRAIGDGLLFAVALAATVAVGWNVPAEAGGAAGLGSVAAAQNVRWAAPFILETLFSSDHGLLSWSPLLYLCIPGLWLLWRRDRSLGLALALAFLAQVWVNGMVGGGGGAAFGARRFLNCAPVFGLALAASLRALMRRPMVPLAAIVAAAIAWNGMLMAAMATGQIRPIGGVTFTEMTQQIASHLGNPFSLPASLLFAWRHGAPPRIYDELGVRSYTNLRLDLGSLDDDAFLNHGWAGREVAEGGLTFRWAVGDEADLLVPVRDGNDYRLEIVCAPFAYPGAPVQTITVLVGGERVDELQLRDGLHAYEVGIPARLVSTNLVHLTFRFGYARSPSSVGSGDDRRPLAVLFDRLRLWLDS